MKIGTPFTLDNFSEETKENQGFEFTQNNIWNDSFYSPEIKGSDSFAILQRDISDIKDLIADIRDIIKQFSAN